MALHSGDLDDDTENHDPTAQDHSPSTAEQITDPENEHGTEQTSNLVDGSDKALHGAVLCLGEVVMERVSVNDSRHDTLIVTEEEETSCRNCRDGQGQFLARQACKSGRHVGWLWLSQDQLCLKLDAMLTKCEIKSSSPRSCSLCTKRGDEQTREEEETGLYIGQRSGEGSRSVSVLARASPHVKVTIILEQS